MQGNGIPSLDLRASRTIVDNANAVCAFREFLAKRERETTLSRLTTSAIISSTEAFSLAKAGQAPTTRIRDLWTKTRSLTIVFMNQIATRYRKRNLAVLRVHERRAQTQLPNLWYTNKEQTAFSGLHHFHQRRHNRNQLLSKATEENITDRKSAQPVIMTMNIPSNMNMKRLKQRSTYRRWTIPRENLTSNIQYWRRISKNPRQNYRRCQRHNNTQSVWSETDKTQRRLNLLHLISKLRTSLTECTVKQRVRLWSYCPWLWEIQD